MNSSNMLCDERSAVWQPYEEREYGPMYEERAPEKVATSCSFCGLSLPRMISRIGWAVQSSVCFPLHVFFHQARGVVQEYFKRLSLINMYVLVVKLSHAAKNICTFYWVKQQQGIKYYYCLTQILLSFFRCSQIINLRHKSLFCIYCLVTEV